MSIQKEKIMTINIFGSIDVTGILKTYGADMTAYYGNQDPTDSRPSNKLIKALISKAAAPMKIGGGDYKTLAQYTRLISSRDATIGYKILPSDTITEKGSDYLKNTYNLSIRARSGDTIRWWGHTINPGQSTQAVIHDITGPNGSARPREFVDYASTNSTFYFAGEAIYRQEIKEGFAPATQRVYCNECTLQGTKDQIVTYDIKIYLLSGSFHMERVGEVTVPIAEIVVDPTIRII
jgi:hypothetical protein